VIHLGQTAAERAAYYAALRSSHRIRVGVQILNNHEKAIEALHVPTSRIVSGSVTVDATADITRSLNLVYVDQKQRAGFDAASPGRGVVFADNLVSVTYGVETELGWVDVPVFWGPVTKLERQAELVTLEAQGKEALALDPHFATNGYTIRKGRRVDDAIRDVMDRVGETRYNLPDLPKRLQANRAVQPDDQPWDVVKFGWSSTRKIWHGKGTHRRAKDVDVNYNGLIRLAGHFYAFYDGRGRLTVRRRSNRPLAVLAEGRDLVSVPDVSWDSLAARNHVVVTGAKVTVGKKHVQRRGSATLHPGHPLSPYAIGRNGKPRYMTEFITLGNLKTQKACEDAAKGILHVKANEGLDLTFDMLPWPHLEEFDVVRVTTSSYAADVPLSQFTIPLTTDQPMTVGYSRTG
jgi:hypothetical protein